MRTIWKGAVSFGLVSIPVRLYSAVEEKDVSFHQVRASDGSRIEISNAMMPITTNNSTRVNPWRRDDRSILEAPFNSVAQSKPAMWPDG